MVSPKIIWRLEGGFSRFIEGSRVELRLEKGPVRQSLDASPLALVRRSQPIELRFRARKGFRGEAPAGLSWRLNPESTIRAVFLFSGNAFLGNFRVPTDHFAVQWAIEVDTETEAGRGLGPLFLNVDANSRVYQSWVVFFTRETSGAAALRESWRSYRDPFDSKDVFQMKDGEVIRWRWSGGLRLGMDFQWGLGAGWMIPGQVPLINMNKRLEAEAGFGARLEAAEEGTFALQLRKRQARLELRLRRHRQRTKQVSLSAGAHLGTQVRVARLNLGSSGIPSVVTKALSQPLKRKMNQVLKQALVRRLEIKLAVEKTQWKGRSTVLAANWPMASLPAFRKAYGQFLRGRLDTDPAMQFTGRFERVQGRRLTVSFNVFNWIRYQKSTRRESRQALIVGPTGEVLLEETEELEKTRHRWDEVQLLRLLHRETTGKADRSREFLWTYGEQDAFSHPALRRLLRMALHMGIFQEFRLPPRAAFPLSVQLLLATRFSAQGLRAVRRAGRQKKWKALVRALELAEPDRYAQPTFWRDWIDHAKVRQKVDEDPVQAHRVAHYPLGRRSRLERQLVVRAYRTSKHFFALLESWERGDLNKILKAFSLGMDIPVFVFFHLLCPKELRSSAAVATGEFEQAWGEAELLEQLTADNSA